MPENIFELSVGAGVALLLIKEFVAFSTAQKKEREMQAMEARLNKIDDTLARVSLTLEKLTILLEVVLKERSCNHES